MKAVQLLLNSQLPPDLRDYTRTMDKKSISSLLSQVAQRYPDRYSQIAKTISDLGRNASYRQGETLTLADMSPVIDRESLFAKMDAELAQAKRVLPKREFEQRRLDIWSKYTDVLTQKTRDAALKQNSNLAYSVVSGARGNPAQMRMMISTPAMYYDAQNKPVPLFVRRSLGDGVRPAEYLASTYGARKAVISTKVATAKGGDLGKQMVQVATPLVITERDCGTKNGIDLDIADPSIKGRVLADATKSYGAGTIVDRQALNQLQNKDKLKKLIVRSPITCEAHKGICAKCAGTDIKGKFLPIGESVGIAAAQAISEPITQGALNVKHGGGAASGSANKKVYGGFDVISRFVQTPETFPDKAVVAKTEGTVSSISKAPQGGYYVKVGDSDHYVGPGYEVLVKKGDNLEFGDQISEGIVDPGEMVNLRGLGEGRRYYADRLHQLLEDSGAGNDRRNSEILARAALDHVEIDDVDDGDPYLPEDVVSYSHLLRNYSPPEDTKREELGKSVGKYLQQPLLHYTIGTRITPNIVKRLKEVDKTSAYVSGEPPKFKPHMVRLRTAGNVDRDWMAGMHTSYLKSNLEHSAIRGDDTNVGSNVHFAPRIAIGEGYAKNIQTTGEF